MSAEQSNLSIQDEISAAILQVLRDAHSQLNCDIPTSLTLERPKNRDHGDYATSIALALSKPSGIAPRKIAEIIVAGLSNRKDIAALEIAGPGFVNITLDKSSQGGVIANILTAGKSFGYGNKLNGVAINLEFISANPTGPLHLGHTRWAAVGDALGRVLSAAGAKVTREFYINDRGVQMDKFGASLQSAALGEPRPEDGYHGAYIDDLAKEVVVANPEVLKLSGEEQTFAFRDIGYKLQLAQQQNVLDKFGTRFDVWFSEKSLYDNNFFAHCQEVL
jgi:arginyl-tRNA synthetase